MTETLAVPAAHPHAYTILQRSVCLTLTRHYLGNARKVDLDKLVEATGGTSELDERQFHATMRLIDPKELRPVMGTFGRAMRYLTSRTVRGHRIFGNSTFLVPITLVETLDETLRGFADEIHAEAVGLSERYANAVATQAVALGPMFNPALYKSPDEVARAFSLEWDYVSFAAPERLETVDRALFERARDRYEQRMAAAYEEVRLVLRESLQQITEEIVRKLTPDDDGRPKTFRNNILDGLREFLNTFSFRNITDDDELSSVANQLRGLTMHVEPTQLRDIDQLRQAVRSRISEATATLNALVETSRRAISFGPITPESTA